MSNILILSCGGLGYSAVMTELAEEGHKIVGVDCRSDHHGQYIPDAFYRIPRYDDIEPYVKSIRKIVKKQDIDYITGGHTRELIILQEHGFGNVLASDPGTLRETVDKHKTYERFNNISPEFAKIETVSELYKSAVAMGFPDRALCFKPVMGSGARGFRILVDKYDKEKWTFNNKKDPHMQIDELAELDFPPLLLMEYLEGPVYHVDVLADEGEIVKMVVSKRLEERFGFGFSLRCVDRPDYVEMAERVVGELGLNYNCFIQIIDGKLLEVGGRCQGSVGIGLDLVKNAIVLAQGKQPNIDTRQIDMIRYWQELYIDQKSGDFALSREFT